jgi:hypothetical protein
MCRFKNWSVLLLILVIAAVLIYLPALKRYLRIHTM